jgi:hypothetical protein
VNLSFHRRLRAVIGGHSAVVVPDLQAPAGQFPLLALVLEQQHAMLRVEGNALHGDRP